MGEKMKKKIPKRFLDLLTKNIFGHLATMMPDHTPYVSLVGVDFDGVHVLINSAEGRQEDLNMRQDPYVAVGIQDPKDPFRYLSIRGVVMEITKEGAEEHLDGLILRYASKVYDHHDPEHPRVLYKIKPIEVNIKEK